MTRNMPMVILHTGDKCIAGKAVKIENYSCELLNGAHAAVSTPIAFGPCECCGEIADAEVTRIGKLAIEHLLPSHVLRQAAFASGQDTLVDEKELSKALGIKHTRIWEHIKDGELPEPMRTGRSNRWLLNEAKRAYARVLAEPTGKNQRAPLKRKAK